MFSHIVVGTNDLEKARSFYNAVLGALGYADIRESDDAYIYVSESAFFRVTRPIDGRPATHANGGTIGFTCRSTEQVDQWHAVGVATGGKSIRDPPGIRNTSAGAFYAAYLRDPDGNKLCALYRMPA